jgi:hypothetical protein
MGRYHLFQRDKEKLGKKAPWYYWYWEGEFRFSYLAGESLV